MKLLLEKIVKDCLEAGINVETQLMPDGEFGYNVSGFSKSGTALLYVEGEAVICKTRYDNIDHVLTIKDLAYIAHRWYDNYKDREPFENPDPNWKILFDKFRIHCYESENRKSSYHVDDEDLPS